jgi:hypothetical protein
MPAYTKLRTFVNALKTGTTHITECLDAYFGNLNAIQAHSRFSEFVNGDWSSGPPTWLGSLLRNEVGLTGAERDL